MRGRGFPHLATSARRGASLLRLYSRKPADSWLQTNIAPLLASSAFQSGGLLIITFDESEDSDIENGGGHVATVIISPQAKKGYQSQTLYQHQSTLRLMLAGSGVDTFPGMSATAPDMAELFTGN